MDTKLKNTNKKIKKTFNKATYNLMFILCGFSFLISITGILFINGHGPWGFTLFPNMGMHMGGNWYTMMVGITILVAIVITLATLIYLISKTGERDEEGNIILKGIDRWYTEIHLLMVTGIFGVFGMAFVRFTLAYSPAYENFLHGYLRYMMPSWADFFRGVPTVSFFGAFVTGFIGVYLGLYFILSIIKKIKAGTFFTQSIIGKLVIYLIDTVFKGGSTMRKVVLVIVLLIVFSAIPYLAPVVLIVALLMTPRLVKKYDEVKKGIDEVKSGNLDYKIPVDEHSKNELDKMARGINEISLAAKSVVEKELKNQRMKSELISNVSHDLKTPITSMVTYIDLLKTEGLKSKNAPSYLEVLDQKTERLKQLTDDLFEAAKASSGSMPVKLEKVELTSLVNQGLGELNRKIEESGLTFILNNKKDKHYVLADGQLLWRVMENILGNSLKYAQDSSRVYIDIKEEVSEGSQDEDIVILEVKNVSREPLNVDPDELMERFKQADEARAGEGSGLGLAIAKDLVKLQGGLFEIQIDGDLFKAIVVLNKYIEQEEPKDQNETENEQEAPITESEEADAIID